MAQIIVHHNTWNWGTQDTIILGGGLAFCNVGIENDDFSVAYLSGVSVLESVRHRGWGNQLLQEAERNARERGAKWLYLWAEPKDWPIEWYKRHGFAFLYYRDDGMAMLKKKL